MKKTILSLSIIAIINFHYCNSQSIPTNVPKNGLIGYWSFNGNADDGTNSANHGTINGSPSLTEDRFGNSNSAYKFDGVDDYIVMKNAGPTGSTSRTVSFWLKTSTFTKVGNSNIFNYGNNDISSQDFRALLYTNGTNCNGMGVGITGGGTIFSCDPTSDNWKHYVITFSGGSFKNFKVYENGIMIKSICFQDAGSASANTSNANPITIGRYHWAAYSGDKGYYTGILDDFGLWNRELDSNEIKQMFDICKNTISTGPANLNVKTTQNANFSISTKINNLNVKWQTTAVDLPWVELPKNSNYSIINPKEIQIKPLSISNHKQKFRAIVSLDGCSDTSNIAELTLTDTCLNIYRDTITEFIKVTDTLFIKINSNNGITINAFNIKIYPNPAKNNIIIDCKDYLNLRDYEIIITDATGKTIYSNPINKEKENLDINNWGGSGLYFVKIFDPKGNRIEIVKIILE